MGSSSTASRSAETMLGVVLRSELWPTLLSLAVAIALTSECRAMNEVAALGGESWLEPHLVSADYPAELQGAVERLNSALTKTGPDGSAGDAEDLAETLRSLETLEAKLPRGAKDEACTLRGLALEKLGQNTQALEAYDRSLSFRAGSSFTIFRRGVVLDSLGRHKEAAETFKEVLWRSTQHQTEVLYALAGSLNSLGESAAAAQALEKAYALDPDFLPVSRLLVQTRLKQLDASSDPATRKALENQALASLQMITAKAPDDEQSSYLLARLLLNQGNLLVSPDKLAQAETLAERLASSSGYRNERYVRLLFDVQLKLGKPEAAEETLHRAGEHAPRSAGLIEAQKQLAIERAASASRVKSE